MILRGFRVDLDSWQASNLMFDRSQIDEGFGHECPYWCENCGPIDKEPEAYMSHRGCGFEGYCGPEPDEWEGACVYCGSIETGEMDDHAPYRKTRHYRLRRQKC